MFPSKKGMTGNRHFDSLMRKIDYVQIGILHQSQHAAPFGFIDLMISPVLVSHCGQSLGGRV